MRSHRTVYHVAPQDGSWAVTEEDCAESQRIYRTKDEAIEQARKRARDARLGLLKIHLSDGTIHTQHAFGAALVAPEPVRENWFPRTNPVVSPGRSNVEPGAGTL
jgi:hypothetical protein